MRKDTLFGPIDTIVDHETAEQARKVIAAIRAELAAVREHYRLLQHGKI